MESKQHANAMINFPRGKKQRIHPVSRFGKYKLDAFAAFSAREMN